MLLRIWFVYLLRQYTSLFDMVDTKEQFEKVIAICRGLFEKKLSDYGPSWRIMRPKSVTDQIFIKVNRIRSLETKGVALVDEGIKPEFIAIVNYGAIGLIQLELGYSDASDITSEEALRLYDKHITIAKELMYAKNHDYDEAWRSMRISSYTDLILMKIYRTKEIEDNKGITLVSEGVDANYMDMINYALFGLIKLEFGEES
ncbi:hypothetical protein AGMMS49574_25240 [Bacteroidia bacterium]|nr:hypothetical protein AGMMS49574_25240 [Bacteroidia bacterium]